MTCSPNDLAEGHLVAEPWQQLKVGDRIRFVEEPPEWRRPDYHLPPGTRRLVRGLIARRRPLRIYEVDEWGAPWIRCRFRRTNGEWEHHFLAITEGGWVRVRSRA
jgi:hypothetical protein